MNNSKYNIAINDFNALRNIISESEQPTLTLEEINKEIEEYRKYKNPMNTNQLFNECIKNIPNNLSEKLDMSFHISDKIDLYLKENNMSKKDLAQKMNKRTSEITKWLSGTHNFNIYTLYDIASTLNVKVTDLLK